MLISNIQTDELNRKAQPFDMWIRRGTEQTVVEAEVARIHTAASQFADDFALAQYRITYPDLVN